MQGQTTDRWRLCWLKIGIKMRQVAESTIKFHLNIRGVRCITALVGDYQ